MASFLFDRVLFLREKSYCHAKITAQGCCCFPFAWPKRGGFPSGRREVLSAACVFHDCCRLNDDKDVGHGQRAAERYRAVCGELGLSFDERVFFIMRITTAMTATGKRRSAVISARKRTASSASFISSRMPMRSIGFGSGRTNSTKRIFGSGSGALFGRVRQRGQRGGIGGDHVRYF